jgi:hypothetical protein
MKPNSALAGLGTAPPKKGKTVVKPGKKVPQKPSSSTGVDLANLTQLKK